MKMKQVIERYARALRFKGLAETTIKSYSGNLKCFFTYTQNWNIDSWMVEDYLAKLLERRIEHSTYNQVMYSIQHYCSIFGYPFPKEIKKLRQFKQIELIPAKEQVLSAIRQEEGLKEKVVLLCLYDGFLRKTELQQLLIKDIDFSQDLIKVRRGKGSKDRVIDISPSTKWFIYYYLEQRKEKNNPYLLSADSYKKYVSGGYIYQVVSQVGLGHPHLLRHAGATHTYQETGDLLYVSNKLGHNDIKTTQIYLNFGREHLAVRKPINYLPLIRNNLRVVIEGKNQ